MLSIIVAVHNQLGHNQLFLEGIQRYTTGPYEVIGIDNHSNDESAEFFEASGCRVIRNDRNRCYHESMNLGSELASGEFLCHMNNDLCVAPSWNGFLIDAMERHRLHAASSFGQRLVRRVVKPMKKMVQELDRATVWRGSWGNPDRVIDEYRRQFQQAAPVITAGMPS